MKINKTAVAGAPIAAADMELINGLALQELSPDDVFTFRVEACNDLIDRDNERFPLDTLRKLILVGSRQETVFTVESQCQFIERVGC